MFVPNEHRVFIQMTQTTQQFEFLFEVMASKQEASNEMMGLHSPMDEIPIDKFRVDGYVLEGLQQVQTHEKNDKLVSIKMIL